MPKFTRKRKSFGIEMKTFQGSKGETYLVLTDGGRKYHVFGEVEAKKAAIDCGCKLDPRKNGPGPMWKDRWKNAQNQNIVP